MSRPPLLLAGRTAVVTGAASGIGRALAVASAKQGMAVAICDVSGGPLEKTAALVREAGAAVLARQVDVTDAAAVDAFADEVHAKLPPVALLFANAGILRQGRLIDMAPAEWRLLFEVNVIGVATLLRSFVPAMAGAGEASQVVITGSTGSMVAPPSLGVYCATKHAIWAVADALREELAAEGAPVGVSLLMPGAVATQIFATVDPDRETPADSITPDRVAEILFGKLANNPPFILTHPDYIPRAEARFAATVEGLR
ncbi:SDR family NAD(P)-dependent oxidoreductase [Sphingoaurantiacus capsulatus]|uniref:SDR family NAD(P)-dependent oxidoreductase n=1 Tax=Sphingoaurantiacus capsulatus TaxID=1771310 RepID=A0ABV7XB82_9SPHN